MKKKLYFNYYKVFWIKIMLSTLGMLADIISTNILHNQLIQSCLKKHSLQMLYIFSYYKEPEYTF